MIDLVRATALLEQTRKMPSADFAVAEGPREGLHVTAAAEAGRAQLYVYDIIGGYDGVTARQMVNALASVEGDIDLHVNSPGGIIYEGAAIYNALSSYQRDGKGSIYAVVDGMAASAASFIVQAATEITIEANATMMVHDGQGLAWGTASVMREAADLLDMLSNTIAEMYAKRAGKTAAEWRAVMTSGDTWYNAAESVEAGLADRVLDAAVSSASNVLGLFAPTASTTHATTSVDADFLDALKGAFA